MSLKIAQFDPKDRVRAKAIARQKDQSALNENQVSAQDLRSKNSFVKGVDFSRARLISKSGSLALAN